jgi:hypothetical protein
MNVVTNNHDILSSLCKAQGKWGVLVSGLSGSPEETEKAAPWFKDLDPSDRVDLTVLGEGFLFFETEEEAHRIYDQTVGDDGPTKLNPYKGPAKVYACLCSPRGNLLTDNT